MVKSMEFILNVMRSLWKLLNMGVMGISFMFLKDQLEHEYKKGPVLTSNSKSVIVFSGGIKLPLDTRNSKSSIQNLW